MSLRVATLAIFFVSVVGGACCAEEGGSSAFSPFARGAIGVARRQQADSGSASFIDTEEGNIGSEEDDPLDDEIDDVPAITDYLNSNGESFTFFIVDLDGDGEIDDDEIIFTDYGDLYEYDVYFDEVRVDAVLRANSYELMKQEVLFTSPGVNTRRTGWRFDSFVEDWHLGLGDQVNARNPVASEHWRSIRNGTLRTFVREMKTSLYTTHGLRINDYRSWSSWLETRSILGETGATVKIDHFAIGPQVGLGAVAESSIWRFEAVGLVFAGYQHSDADLKGSFAHGLVPGGLNVISVGATSSVENGLEEDDFAYGLETRLTAGVQLTRRWRFDTTWRAAVVGPIYDAAEAMGYNVPNYSLQPTSGDDVTISDLFLGLTYVR